MEKGLYTYNYISDNKIRIRFSNEKDFECDTFDRVEDITYQMEKENTEVENKFNNLINN